METRLAKVNISNAGGTSAKGSKTYKVTLPNSWVKELGIGLDNREIELSFTGNQIIISPKTTEEDFMTLKKKEGHDLRILRYYHEDTLCTTIYTDFSDKTIRIKNHVDDPVILAFGNKMYPSWDDLQLFLEERCIPRERDGLREYLEAIGVCSYDPYEIILKTKGHMAEDKQWIDVEVI